SLVSIRSLFENAGMDISLGSVFSIYEDKKTKQHFNYYRGSTESLSDCGLGEFIAIDDLTEAKFESSELQGLIHRYILEYKSGPFIEF
ncbi:MAG: hypothetical protein DSY80_08205, partial [Desulfocapsa sp.]